jgi:nicotinate phosphoribosyltransferase
MAEPAAGDSLLRTDHYQLTMAQAYRRHGLAERRVRFDAFFRRLPDYGEHQAGYAVFAGLADLLGWMARARLGPAERDQLRSLRGAAGHPLFDEDFLTWLDGQRGWPGVRLLSVPEGRVVHPEAPFATVEGPLALVQLLETALLNHLDYATLVATKAARLRQIAGSAALLEFGLRRAQGCAADAGSRAALIGGVDASSNVATSLRLGVPSRGTHAHSFVQAVMAAGGSELEAFRAYAATYPDDCVLLLDTVDTLGSGLPNAVTVFEELRRRGSESRGVRLDSGDLAHLAVQVARALDTAGFPDATITLSNQLDELTIWQVRQQVTEEAEAIGLDPQAVLRRLAYGVGTRLITSHGAPALDGVFKLVAVESAAGWRPSVKRSDSPDKATIPGAKDLYRVYDERAMATADVMTLTDEPLAPEVALRLHHPRDARWRELSPDRISAIEPLLEVAWDDGEARSAPLDIAGLRRRRERDEERLDVGVRRLRNPHRYHVSLSEGLWRLVRETLGSRSEAAARQAPPERPDGNGRVR